MKDNKQNFDELKKLLQLKRHEVPPPGFFNNFSDKVVARIQSGEVAARGSAFERLQLHSPWLAQFISFFETKSSLFGMAAAGLCLLVMVGVVMNDKSDKTAPNFMADVQNSSATAMLAPLPSPVDSHLVDGGGGIQVSANPAGSLQPVATLFGQENPLAQGMQASFAPAH